MTKQERTIIDGSLEIHSLKPNEVPLFFKELEEPNWAPWLAASEATLSGRASVFPSGQLVMKDKSGAYVASLSMNQINMDPLGGTFPSWDSVAGYPTDYSQTYDLNGNTLVLMSMNVAPEYKGMRMPDKMIDHALIVAKELGVTYVLGSFRPTGYGHAKKELGHELDFTTYCNMLRDGKPLDPWLRSLWWKGMDMLAVDNAAMVVEATMDEFDSYRKTYHPEMWEEVEPHMWECGEVGKWTVKLDIGKATYIESNVWGRLPFIP